MSDADYKKLSLLIQKYCPDFLAEKRPKFIAFLKAYYDWSYNVKGFNPWRVVSHLIEWGDIDETLDEFIDYFKAEYLNNLNVDFNGDIREFIKHTKEFYSSRGTPESFRFLLTLLSGNSGEVFYPNRFLMKSSDGVWRTDHNIFIEYSEDLDQSFISTKIQGKYSGVTATIESIETHFDYLTQNRYLKLYISNLDGVLSDDIIVFKNEEKTLELSIYKTASSVDIISAGNNYNIGDTLTIENNPTFICRVSSIKTGKIDSYAILDGGTGYSIGDEVIAKCDDLDYYYAYPKVYVDDVDITTGAITSLDIRYPGYGYFKVPVVERISSLSHLINNNMLPEGYTPLEYVENDGINYLDSDYILKSTDKVELKFRALPVTNPDIDQGIFGAESAIGENQYTFLFNEENSVIKTGYGDEVFEFHTDLTADHYIKRDHNKLYVDNVPVHEDTPTIFNTVNGASVFSTIATGSHTAGKCRFYFARVYNEHNVVVANYVPAKRDSDSKIGVFETVGGVFLTNTTGDDFIDGPVAVELRDAEIEFISDDAGAINRVSILNSEINYTDDTPLIITSTTGVGAEAKIKIGNVFTTIPYYYEPGSFLSDDFKLQDSDYWQDYSYEIRSTLSLESDILTQFSEYKDIFKKLVHPAGFKLFNSFILSNHISLDLLYINSTISTEGSATFIDLVNWIEMISHWNRIMDWDIIWQYRLTPISEMANDEIGSYKREGGDFVHSTLELSSNL